MPASPSAGSPDMDSSIQTDTPSSSSPLPTLYNAIDIEDWASARAILLAAASSTSISSSHTKVSPVNYVDEDGVNCFHLASYCRDLPLDLLRSLLNDPSSESALIANDCGRTPLHFAIKKSDDVRIRMMVDACPRAASVADKAGQTALHLAIVCCRSTEAIQHLLSAHPSNATTINNSGETPLKILFQKWSTGLKNVLQSSRSSYIYLDLDRDVSSNDGKMRRKLKWIYEVTILLMGVAATGVVETLPLPRSLPWLTATEEAMCPAPFASLLSRMKEAAVVAPRSPTTSSLSEDGNETWVSDGLTPATHLQIPTTTTTTTTATAITTVPQAQTPAENPIPTAKVIVAGGGVVSLSFVSLLMEYGRRRRLSFEIDVYVGSKGPPSSHLYRLDQIEESVWENLPSQLRDDIFPVLMNDRSLSSSKVIARQQLQERLYELVNDSESANATATATTGSKRNRDGHSLHLYQSSYHSVNLIESELKLDMLKNEENSYDFLVLAEDDESNPDGIEKQICPGAFGPCVPYPEDPKSKLCECVLSILFERDEEQQDTDIMVNTITETLNLSQNRFVLLSLPSSSDEQQRRRRRRGYLNMWLLPEEAEEVGGMDSKMQMGDCGQMNCLFLRDDGSQDDSSQDDSHFKCQTHGTYFTPSIPIMRKYSKLWQKITDGLKLFNIPESCIKGFSCPHRRPYQQRVNFTSTISSIQQHLHDTTHNNSKRRRQQQQQQQQQQQPPMSFLIGTSAFATSCWMGNALSTHLQGAISLARTVTDVSELGTWHAADFTNHSSVMYALQDREVRGKALSMLLGPKLEDDRKTMNDRIKRVLEEAALTDPASHDSRSGGTIRRQEYEGRLRKIFEKVTATRGVDKIRIWNTIIARINEVSEETLSVLYESGKSWMMERRARDMKLEDIIPEPRFWQDDYNSNNNTTIASAPGAATRGMTSGSMSHSDSEYIAPKVFGTFNGTSFAKAT